MQVTITRVSILADGRQQVEFDAKHGHGAGIWHSSGHPDPQPGNVYQIELTLKDAVWMQDNAELASSTDFGLSIAGESVLMTVRVENVDSDNVATFRLGSDCLFFSDVADAQIERGRWMLVCIPIQRLGLFPYDAGPLVVNEVLA